MRALVVGLGHMGTFHRRVLRDLGYEVDAVDPREETGAEYRSTAEAMLGHSYAAAAVAVPVDQLVGAAFELAGCPKLLVEKPFAPTPREAAMLGAYLTERGSVCVNYVERFNPYVRWLAGRLKVAAHVRAVRFTRWSDRPSADVTTDLLTHDVDLARHLLVGGWGNRAVELCHFDVRAGQPEKRRTIEVDVVAPAQPPEVWSANMAALVDQTWRVDLMDHDQSPLHAIWHAFLTEAQVPGPGDAVRALEGARSIANRDESVVEAARG